MSLDFLAPPDYSGSNMIPRVGIKLKDVAIVKTGILNGMVSNLSTRRTQQ
jgi:hypothetical protein